MVIGNGSFSFFCLDTKETKNQGWESSAVNSISNPKRKELAALKQLFFLRIFQLIDTRLPDSNAKQSTNYFKYTNLSTTYASLRVIL